MLTSDYIVDRDFPSDVWSDAGFPDTTRALTEARAALDWCDRMYGAPRSGAILQKFIGELPDGDVYVSGAGTHTAKLLEHLKLRPGIQIRGIVDRLATWMDGAFGYEVVLPEALAGRSYDYVLLSHTSFEAEMTETLIDAGVPAKRIIAIYANPVYVAMARDVIVDAARRVSGLRADNVILATSSSQIISDRRLGRLLPSDRTVEIYFGRDDDMCPSGPFERLCAHESLAILDHFINTLKPRVIYLRGLAYKTYLGSWLSEHHPSVRLIQELYDYTVLWPDDDLTALFGLTPRTIRLARLFEFHSAQRALLTITKRGGDHWEKVQRRCATPTHLYFPLVESDESLPAAWTPQPDGLRLLYGGFLPSAPFLKRFRNAHNFLPVMEALCPMTGCQGDIYNAVHLGPELDYLFKVYLDRYSKGPITYHRRIPARNLFLQMGGYDVGWLADKQYDFQPDRYVAVCNRWAGYVAGGLPCLLDAGWTFMAGYVRQFGAGIIVDSMDPNHIAGLLQAADWPSLRRGTEALRRHVLDHNTGVLDALAEKITPSAGDA